MDHVIVYTDASGEHRWRRVAPNGRTVADSAEGYTEQRGALVAAYREAAGAAKVEIELVTGERYPAPELEPLTGPGPNPEAEYVEGDEG